MAAENKNRRNNPIIAFMEEFNISKTDIIIYSACILALFVSVAVFMFFSKDYEKKMKANESITEELKESASLKDKQEEIKKDFENISEMTLGLRNRFLSEKQINDFKEVVKKLAKEYKCDKIDVNEKAEAREQDTFYSIRRDGVDTKAKLTFRKKAIDFSFQMTLGNFIGFLRALESCNKMIEIPPFRISRGDDDNNVKLTSFTIYVFVVPATLDNDLRQVLEEVTFEEYITPVNLAERAQVVQVKEKKIMVKEVVKASSGEWDIKPIFKPIKPPPPKPIVPPKELKYMMAIGAGKFAFTMHGDNNRPYYVTVGGVLETKNNEKIPGYESLILKSADKAGRSFVFEMEDVTGELKR